MTRCIVPRLDAALAAVEKPRAIYLTAADREQLDREMTRRHRAACGPGGRVHALSYRDVPVISAKLIDAVAAGTSDKRSAVFTHCGFAVPLPRMVLAR